MTVLSFPPVSLLSVRVLHPASVCLLMLREGNDWKRERGRGGRSPFLLNSRHFAVRPHSHLPLSYIHPPPLSPSDWKLRSWNGMPQGWVANSYIHAHTLRREEAKEKKRETIYYKLEQPMIGWKGYSPSCISIHFRLELTGRIKEEGPCVFDDEHDMADDWIMYGDQHNQTFNPLNPTSPWKKNPKRVILIKVGSPFLNLKRLSKWNHLCAATSGFSCSPELL